MRRGIEPPLGESRGRDTTCFIF